MSQGISFKGVKRVMMEIGWESGKSDLDPSAIEVLIPNTNFSVGCIVEGKGKDGKPTNDDGTIVYKNYEKTGHKKETISIDLEKLKLDVSYIIFVTRIFDKDMKFGEVKGGYCKLTSFIEDVSLDVCKYYLNSENLKNESVMMMCMMARDGLEDWKVIELGLAGIGSTWEPNQPCWGRIREKLITPEIHQRMKDSLTNGLSELEKEIEELQTKIDELVKDQVLVPNAMSMKCRAIEVDKMDLFGKSDPYFIVKGEDGSVKYKSEIIMVTLDPDWKNAIIKNIEDFDEELEVDVYDYDKHSSDDYIGSFVFVPSEVAEGDENEFDIINPKKKKKKKNYKNSGLFVFEEIKTKVYQKKLEYFEKMEELERGKKLLNVWIECFKRNGLIETEEEEEEDEEDEDDD